MGKVGRARFKQEYSFARTGNTLQGDGIGYQFSSVTQSCLTLCDPKDCSTPGLLAHCQLPEFTQTHVHWVSDAIQPSHPAIPFSSCLQSFPTSGSFPMSLFFRWPNYSSFSFNISHSNEYSGVISLGRTGWISLQSKGSQESSPTAQFRSINSSVLSFLYSPTLTSIHDYWKKHNFD